MTDFLLNPCGDLDFTEGRLTVVTGADLVRQRWLIRIRTFLGEWFLDQSIGVPYYQRVLIKLPSRQELKQVFASATRATPGVIQVLSVIIDSLDAATRQAEITVTCVVEGDETATFKYTGEIPPEGCKSVGEIPAQQQPESLWYWFDPQDTGNAYTAGDPIDLANKFEQIGVAEARGISASGDPLLLPKINGRTAIYMGQIGDDQAIGSDGGAAFGGSPIAALRTSTGFDPTQWTIAGIYQPDTGQAVPGGDTIGLEVWDGIDVDGATRRWMQMSWGLTAGLDVFIRFETDTVAGSSSVADTASLLMSGGAAFCVVWRRDGADLKCWVDGIVVFDAASPVDAVELNGVLLGGVNFDASGAEKTPMFAGSVGDRMGWTAALDDVEVLNVFAFLKIKYPPGPSLFVTLAGDADTLSAATASALVVLLDGEASSVSSGEALYAPWTVYFTPEGAGWQYWFSPEAGGMVDQIGGAPNMTFTGSPTFNASGSSLSGVPSYSMDDTQDAISTHAALLALGDDLNDFSVYSLWRFTAAASGSDAIWSLGDSGGGNSRSQHYRHPTSSFPTALRNDGAGTTTGTLSEVFGIDEDLFAYLIFTGTQTRQLVRGMNLDPNEDTEQEQVQANTRNVGTCDEFRINASTRGGGGLDRGPTERYGTLLRGDVPTADQIVETEWWARERIGYTEARVVWGEVNAERIKVWDPCPIVNNNGTGALGLANMVPGTPAFDALLDDIAYRPPGPIDLIFIHGKTDSANEAEADLYQARLELIMDTAEARMSGYTFRWFLEPLSNNNTNTWQSTVRTGQDAIVAARANTFSHANSDALILVSNNYQSADRATRQGFMTTLIDAS